MLGQRQVERVNKQRHNEILGSRKVICHDTETGPADHSVSDPEAEFNVSGFSSPEVASV